MSVMLLWAVKRPSDSRHSADGWLDSVFSLRSEKQVGPDSNG